MKRLFPLLIALIIGLIALSSSVFIVRERDYAVVFALGEVKKLCLSPVCISNYRLRCKTLSLLIVAC